MEVFFFSFVFICYFGFEEWNGIHTFVLLWEPTVALEFSELSVAGLLESIVELLESVTGLWEPVVVVVVVGLLFPLLSAKAFACDSADASTEISDLTFFGGGSVS